MRALGVFVPELGDIRFILNSALTTDFGVNISWAMNGKRQPPLELTLAHSAGDRTDEGTNAGLVEGAEILSFNIGHTAKRGQSYVRVLLLHRGRAIQRLARGYCYTGGDVEMGQDDEMLSGQGLKVDNEAASTLVNGTLLSRTITVPTDTRWRVHGGQVLNGDDVTRDILVNGGDGTNSLIRFREETDAAANNAAAISWPGTDDFAVAELSLGGDFILDEADTIAITWRSGGASTGGATRSSAVVEEWIEI